MIEFIVMSDYMRVASGILQVKIPDQSRALLIGYMLEKVKGKRVKLQIGRYYRPRTTGELSQNHAINGFVQQIAKATGSEFEDVKLAAKERAIKRGYPFRTVAGTVKPYHEYELNTLQAGYLIDELKQIADEYDIPLVEVNDEYTG